MAEFIGGPIDEGVVNQLKVRSDVLSRTEGNEKFLKSRLFNSAWINVVSSANLIDGVDSEKGAELAKRYVLSGGSLTWNGTDFNIGGGIDFRGTDSNKVYNYSEAKGVRPRPGITGFQIVSKNRFGAIREATINFNVWSQEDLRNIERLYFRPGFHAVVEWGHSEFVDNDKALQQGRTGVTSEFFNDLDTPSKIAGILKKVTVDRDYNYDSFIGVIKNFSYSFRKDGGYDCVISIISKGEILDSIRLGSGKPLYGDESDEKGFANINVITSLVKTLTLDRGLGGKRDRQSDGDEAVVTRQKLIEWLQKDLEKVYEAYTYNRSQYKRSNAENERIQRIFDSAKAKRDLCIEFLDRFYKEDETFIGIAKEFNVRSIETAGGALDFNVTYLPLQFILNLINFQIDISLTNEQKLKIDVPLFSNENIITPMATVDDMVILDPAVCLVWKRPIPNLYPIVDDASYVSIIRNLPQKNFLDDVSNIFVSSKLVYDLAKRYFSAKTPPSESLAKDFIEDMMDRIGLALGDINEFVITYDETTNTVYIEDKKTTPVKEKGSLQGKTVESYTLPLTGLRSFITDLSIQTKISNQLGSQIAIAAQGSSTDRDYNAYVANYKEWNRNLYDRFTRTKAPETSEEDPNFTGPVEQETVKTVDLEEQRLKFEVEINKLYKKFRQDGTYDNDEWHAVTKHAQTLYKKEEEYEDKAAGRPPKGLIPTELSFTMDGIGGLKIGQSFKVQEGILPFTYNRYGYIITGLEHSIQNGKWLTTVKAQTFILQFKN